MKKVISILLAAVMLFTMVPASVFAAEAISVKLVSFMRGDVTDLRSSELLEVKVEGYDGNPRELTYKWTNTLATYLYIYNSHNMYGINNTYGEYEIYNSSKNISRSSNVEVDRAGDKTLSKEGFMWAAVYGAYNSANSALKGEVTVEVFDKNGKSLGSDSFSSFQKHNLASDLDNVVIGLFEGDRMNVLDLLGQSGVVHITCTASSVSSATVKSGGEHIVVEKVEQGYNNNNYFIVGKMAGDETTNGDAELEIKIVKENCKFHKNTNGSAKPIVYVFKKPTTSTTTTTLTLVDNIDSRCTYFINGVEGTKQTDGTILFTGLTPNTNYTVEVRAEYDDNGETKYVYGYVDDTTKPVYKATVQTYLDDVLTNIGDIHGEDVTLYLHEDVEGAEYIALKKDGTGVYTAEVTNGVYFPWHIEAGDHYHKAKEFKLIIENANGHLDLHHYSATYDANGGAFADGEVAMKEIYPSASAVTASSNVPVREGYIFAGWEYEVEENKTVVYTPGEEITSRISAPITLTAKWEKQVNVTINVTIDHKYQNGYDHNENKDELVIDFLEMAAGSPAFVETGDKLNFSKDNFPENYEYITEKATDGKTVLVTKYTATAPTYEGLLASSSFGVAVSKSGYDVGTIEKIIDENGNWTINVPLTYNPNDFNLEFSVEMEEGTPKELYPDAVIVKIACWDKATNEWIIISQQRTTELTVRPGVRVDIDPETGKGVGSYPVWMYDANGNAYGYRAVVAGFIYDNKTISTVSVKEENNAVIAYTDGNYTATMDDISDGKLYSTSLYGAYYNDSTNKQQGTLHGVISVEKYNVTFDAKGGTVNGKDKDVAKQQYYIPELDDYKPTMENHNFLGWYADEGYTIPAEEGKLLTEDITLYAKWDKTLTGTLIVDGYYTDESGTQHKVDDVDRAKYALVELEEIFDGHTYDIAGQTVEVEWTEGEHASKPVDYEFKGLDPDKTYRINVYLMNYEAGYQNSTTIINGNGDIHDDYNDKDYTAVYPKKELTTFVNTFLHFEPEEYVQNVIVDASTIGEGFRPENALVKYYSEEIGVDDEYVLITQHKGDNEGVNVTISADGKTYGEYGDKVWKNNYNGNLYDYQASLSKLLKEGYSEKVSDWPVSVVYGAPSRYSPLNDAPTGVLQVKLVPNRYGIIYNEMYAVEDVNVVSYGTHIWSYKTIIDYVPVRDGYDFEGWYSNPECTGEKVTAIPASVAENTELYAKWKKRADLELKVNYVDKDTNEALATETKAAQTFGSVITAESLKKDFAGYSYDSASAESVTIGTGTNEITLYYVRNSYGYTVNYLEEGTNNLLAEAKIATAPYGASVTEKAKAIDGYSVVGESEKDITIDTANNVINFFYAKRSDLGLTVNYVIKGTDTVLGTETKADQTFGTVITAESLKKDFAGYSYDSASADSVTISTGTNEITLYYVRNSYSYTVNYLEKDTDKVLAAAKTLTVNAAQGSFIREAAIDITGYSVYGDNNAVLVVGDANNVINFYYTVNSYGYTVNYLDEKTGEKIADSKNATAVFGTSVTESAISVDKYILSGDDTATITIDADTNKNVINFYYACDNIGNFEENGNDTQDGIPDKYQKKVIFKVVNGTWSNNTTADIVKVVTLMKDGKYDITGTAELTGVPTGMIANDGFVGGLWDIVPPASVSGTATEIFTYSFEKKPPEYVIEIPDEVTVYEEETTEITVVIIPNEGADESEIPEVKSYESTDESIAIVDQNGKVTGVKEGTTTVIVTFTDGTQKTVIVNVKEREGIHVVFGKTDGIGWYTVSRDGGKTFETVFGNSTLEVKQGTQLIIKVGDIMGDTFVFYVNGEKVQPDENGQLIVTVNGYMLIGALSVVPEIDFEVPDTEESLNWFQRIIKAIKDFFAKIFGKK